MAGNKKDTNTSKTAHVMNLISRGRSTKPQPEEAAPASPAENAVSEKAPAAQPAAAPAVSPIISIMNADAKASAVIKDALEESLLAELSAEEAAAKPMEESLPEASPKTPAAPPEPLADAAFQAEPSAPSEQEAPVPKQTAPAPTPEVEASPVLAEPPISEEPFVFDTLSAPAEAVEPDAPQPEEPVEPDALQEPANFQDAAAAEPETPAAADKAPSSPQEAMPGDVTIAESAPENQQSAPAVPHYVNVMEKLVEKNIDKYIKMFGLCSCPQCRADVAALALTNLVPLYVVVPENEFSFRMVIYENRFQAEVTAQILHACKAVMDSPRHPSV